MLYSVQHMLKTFKQKANKKEPKKYQNEIEQDKMVQTINKTKKEIKHVIVKRNYALVSRMSEALYFVNVSRLRHIDVTKP